MYVGTQGYRRGISEGAQVDYCAIHVYSTGNKKKTGREGRVGLPWAGSVGGVRFATEKPTLKRASKSISLEGVAWLDSCYCGP